MTRKELLTVSALIKDGASDSVILRFMSHYECLLVGLTGNIYESWISPVHELEPVSHVSSPNVSKLVSIKLNGGLATAFNSSLPRSCIEVKEGLTFLDIAYQQAQQDGVPLILMNSYATSYASRQISEKYKFGNEQIPMSFTQGRAPKLLKDALVPAQWPDNPELAFYPIGHGDVYRAMMDSGVLNILLGNGYEHAFISSADNLGATADRMLYQYFVGSGLNFMLEFVERTESDKKGGHLALDKNGEFIVRELAQCYTEDLLYFQDIEKYKYFSANNAWVDLQALKEMLVTHRGILPLPMIWNRKYLNPGNPGSPEVYQLETSMGHAISVFEKSQPVLVPRSRLVPMKTPQDLQKIRAAAKGGFHG